MSPSITIAPRVALRALPGVPIIEPGADLGAAIWSGLGAAEIALADGDVVVVASKLVSRASDRFVDMSTVEVSPEARKLADEVDKDPRLVELIVRESAAVSRAARHVLIVRHKLGFVSANAAIDQSNARPADARPDSGPWALLMPEDPDADARALRADLQARSGRTVGVIISDSFGRPFRVGTVGVAVGVAGVPAVNDMRGRTDLHGRTLEHTQTALADQIAAAADLVAGQADEARGVVHVRGLTWTETAGPERESERKSVGAAALLRDPQGDLYA